MRYMGQAKHVGKVVIRQGRPGIRQQSTYVITGGLGALGLRTAISLAEEGAEHLVLLSRGEPKSEALECIAALEARGVAVLVRQVDVCDGDAVRELWSELSKKVPPIRGVIHAAGQLNDGPFIEQTWESLSRSMTAKVLGGWNLAEVTREHPVDFLVMFSSVASVIGSAGQGGYSAANGFLDVLSESRARSCQAMLSINWGAWSGGGMAARLEGVAKQRLAEQGIHWIEPVAGMQMLQTLIRTDAAQVVVAPMDWPRYVKRFDTTPPLLQQWGQAVGKGADSKQEELGKTLRELAPGARLKHCIDWVRDQVRSVLHLSASTPIGHEEALKEMGVDSLMAVELRNRLARGVGVKLPAGFVYDFPNVQAMAEELLSVLGLDLSEEGAALKEATAVESGLEGLSDDEMLLAVQRELGDVAE